MAPLLYIIAGVLFIYGYAGKKSDNPKKRKICTVLFCVSIAYAGITLIFDVFNMLKQMGML